MLYTYIAVFAYTNRFMCAKTKKKNKIKNREKKKQQERIKDEEEYKKPKVRACMYNQYVK